MLRFNGSAGPLTAIALTLFLVSNGLDAAPLSLLLQADFKHGADRWQTTDPAEPFWTVVDSDRGNLDDLTVQGIKAIDRRAVKP